MKRFIAVVLSFVFLLSGLAYVNLRAIESTFKELPSLISGEVSFVEELKEIISMEPIYEMVPVEYRKAVEEVMEKAQSDKKIEKLVDDQMSSTLDDLVTGKSSFDQNLLTQELLDAIEPYSKEIEKASDNKVSKEMITTKMEKVITGYDLNSRYESVLVKVQSKLPPKAITMLSKLNVFNQNIDLFKTISLIIAGVSLLALFLIRASSLFFTSINGLVLVFVSSKILPFIINTGLDRVSPVQVNINLDQTIYKKAYMVLVATLVIGLIARILKYNQQFEIDEDEDLA